MDGQLLRDGRDLCAHLGADVALDEVIDLVEAHQGPERLIGEDLAGGRLSLQEAGQRRTLDSYAAGVVRSFATLAGIGVAPSGPGDDPPIESLTRRELEVLRLVAEGLGNRSIAERLGITEHTAKFHVHAILGKLGTQSRTEAVVRAARLGLIAI